MSRVSFASWVVGRRPGFLEQAASPQAVLIFPGPRFTGSSCSLWPSACWAALGNCGFPTLSALFAGGVPVSDLCPAAWEAEPLQGELDITSLVGDILWACVWFT